MSPEKYTSVPQEDLEGSEMSRPRLDRTVSRVWERSLLAIMLGVVLVSSALNFSLSHRLMTLTTHRQDVTEWAGLGWDKPTVVNFTSEFNSPDREIEDAAWDSELVRPASLGVAFPETYVVDHGLPHSMRWPWDHSKGFYVLTAGHELHCLQLLRTTINEAYDHDRRPSGWPRGHTMHCLEYLLQNVMCTADDTPMYDGRLHANAHEFHPIAGQGEIRMCRDWNKLKAWANVRSACYDPYRRGDPNVKEVDRYKFCPDGSKPWERIKIDS